MKALIIFSLLISSAFAADVGPEDKFLVLPMDESVDASSLQNSQTKVLPAHVMDRFKTSTPSVQKRNEIFKASGLAKSVENWDDFEKDSLIIKLTKPGSEVIERILKKHPELKKSSLEKAQRLVQE